MIVAIHKYAEALIFGVADYSLEADLFTVCTGGRMLMSFTSTQKPSNKPRSLSKLKKQPVSLYFRRQLP